MQHPIEGNYMYVYQVLCLHILCFFLLRNCWEKVRNFELVKINFYRIFRKFAANNLPLGITSHLQQLIIWEKEEGGFPRKLGKYNSVVEFSEGFSN